MSVARVKVLSFESPQNFSLGTPSGDIHHCAINNLAPRSGAEWSKEAIKILQHCLLNAREIWFHELAAKESQTPVGLVFFRDPKERIVMAKTILIELNLGRYVSYVREIFEQRIVKEILKEGLALCGTPIDYSYFDNSSRRESTNSPRKSDDSSIRVFLSAYDAGKATRNDWRLDEGKAESNVAKKESRAVENMKPQPEKLKRRRCYSKRIAAVLNECRPTTTQKSYLYSITMVPKGSSGRKNPAAAVSATCFGLLTTRQLPELCPFAIFTRSGEMQVTLALVNENVTLTEANMLRIKHFMRFTFGTVLRLQKPLMFFDQTATDNCYFVVPTQMTTAGRVTIDWSFLDQIYSQPLVDVPSSKWTDENRNTGVTEFSSKAFADAVVVPRHRPDQGLPQYSYVTEVCRYLTPNSRFPGPGHATYKDYYWQKHGVQVKNARQPLLAVEHTGTRLDFAMATSTDTTKRVKPENQLLIPELCAIHPFQASRMRAALCLPAALFRLNALLVVEEMVRSPVAYHDLAASGHDKQGHEDLSDRSKNGHKMPSYRRPDESNGIQPKTSSAEAIQSDLNRVPGPSLNILLQALTTASSNDNGLNLERLETIGDSFLKFATTAYLYCTHEADDEGALSSLRAECVSNGNLCRLGRLKQLGEIMIATKFDAQANWLPPCYYTPKTAHLEQVLTEAQIPKSFWNAVDLSFLKEASNREICDLIRQRAVSLGFVVARPKLSGTVNAVDDPRLRVKPKENATPACPDSYNLTTEHLILDKSIADCVEALIGAYVIECGMQGALCFMTWMGIRVLPDADIECPAQNSESKFHLRNGIGPWTPPKSASRQYDSMTKKDVANYTCEDLADLERKIGYTFQDPLYLVQAMTHASYSGSRPTVCYQRLEYLGDAVLDYLITRHLFKDPRQHTPGTLTDLRSALVNNAIFASLAVRHGFHEHFKHSSSALKVLIDRFVQIQRETAHQSSSSYYLIMDDEAEVTEDAEVPKALGDLFESVAGAIFLDSGMSLDAVWRVYEKMMRPEIDQCSKAVPKTPVRELMELVPGTAKFGEATKRADGRWTIVVEIFGKGKFQGIGRNCQIAKGAAAKRALRHLKSVKY